MGSRLDKPRRQLCLRDIGGSSQVYWCNSRRWNPRGEVRPVVAAHILIPDLRIFQLPFSPDPVQPGVVQVEQGVPWTRNGIRHLYWL